MAATSIIPESIVSSLTLHGLADVLESDYSGRFEDEENLILGDMQEAVTVLEHDFVGMPAFPTLQERKELQEADQESLGIVDTDLEVVFRTSATITFIESKAGYKNTLGHYEINADGTINAVGIAFANAKKTASGAEYSFDVSGDPETELGFFIIANGFRKNKEYRDIDFEEGELNFVYDHGGADERLAKLTDHAEDISLVYTNGEEIVVLKGHIYHTTEREGSTNLNFDNAVHAVSGLADIGDPGTLRIGFEDLPNLGDADYNDLIFDLDIETQELVLEKPLNDRLSGNENDNLIVGGDGDDTAEGKAGNDIILGGLGADYLEGGAGSDEIHGDDGNDDLFGDDGDDMLYGGAGGDRIFGDLGNDTIYGGDGDDGLKGLWGDDTIYGDAGNDDIFGNAGNDMIFGGSGDDLVDGGSNNDQIDGGSGNDDLRGNTGDDVIQGGLGADFIHGGADNDDLSGDDGNDRILGGSGNDIVSGGAGHDDLRGEAGNDAMQGGDGDDTLSGGQGDDTLQGGTGEDMLLGDEDNDELHGGDGNDRLFGGQGDDTLYGDNGDDGLEGGDGHDTIRGGEGSDVVDGGGGNDTLYGGASIDYLIGGSGDDILNGDDGNDDLRGGSGSDILTGGDGNDLLVGDGGNDTLIGGAGTNNLYGGDGLDTYLYNVNDFQTGYDRIWDFEDGTGGDILDISDLLGDFDPTTDLITDFVSASLYGDGTIVKVDMDGGGSSHNFLTVAWLRTAGDVGDVNNLIADGNLIV